MATFKNFGISGTSSNIQLSKGGGHIDWGTEFAMRGTDDSSLATVRVADPTNNDQAATKLYVDQVAAGLDPKPSMRASTTGALPNAPTYDNGTAGVGATLTADSNVDLADQDGINLVVNDRLLVKDQGTAFQNGLYQMSQLGTGAVPWILTRVLDHDELDEIAGAFTFIEEGSTLADTGWVCTTNEAVTMGTTAIDFSQFAGNGAVTGSDGVLVTGIDVQLDITNLGTVTTVGADEMVFDDGASGSHVKRTITNFLADHDIVNALGGNGIAVQTGADAYTNRSIAVDGTGSGDGLSISNGDGVSANPTLGLDINGMAAAAAAPISTDTLAIFDGTNNEKVTITQLADAIAATVDDTALFDADSDTGIQVEEGADDDTIRFDTGDTPAGYTAVANIMTLASSGWTTSMGVANVATTVGADISFTAGTGNTSGVGGDVLLTAGPGGATGVGGVVTITSGAGGSTSGASGALTLATGTPVEGAGGDITLAPADGVGTNQNGGNVFLTPGTPTGSGALGIVRVNDPGGNEVAIFSDVASSVNYWAFIGGADAAGDGTITMTATGTSTNTDVIFLPKGTGVLTVTGTTTYESNVTDDDDIPNKKYVDDTAGAPSGAIMTVQGTVDFTSASTQNIGGATDLPINAIVTEVILTVTVAANNGGATTTFGGSTEGVAAFGGTGDTDPDITGLYITSLYDTSTAGQQVTVTVAHPGAAPGAGTGAAIIKFRLV